MLELKCVKTHLPPQTDSTLSVYSVKLALDAGLMPECAIPRDCMTSWLHYDTTCHARICYFAPGLGIEMIPGMEQLRGTDLQVWWGQVLGLCPKNYAA